MQSKQIEIYVVHFVCRVVSKEPRNNRYRLESLIGRVIDFTESLNQWSHSFSVSNNTDYLFSVRGDQLNTHS